VARHCSRGRRIGQRLSRDTQPGPLGRGRNRILPALSRARATPPGKGRPRRPANEPGGPPPARAHRPQRCPTAMAAPSGRRYRKRQPRPYRSSRVGRGQGAPADGGRRLPPWLL